MTFAAVDTEGTGLTLYHGARPFMLQACDGESNYWWKGHVNPYDRTDIEWNPKDLKEFLEFILSYDAIVFHNAKYDIRGIYLTLKKYNLEKGFLNYIFRVYEDTMLACHALCSGDSVALKHNAFKYCDMYNDTEHILAETIQAKRRTCPAGYDLADKKHPAFGGVTNNKNIWKADYWLDIEACLEYGLDDVEMTYLLWKFCKQALLEDNLLKPYQTRKRLLEAFYHLEDTGVNMYNDLAQERIKKLEDECEALRLKIQKDNHYHSSLNLDSAAGLDFLVHDKLGIQSRFSTPGGAPSIKKAAIESYTKTEDHPSLHDLSLYRKKKKQISDIESYSSWICPDGRLHANYWICGTRATRQTASDPGIQIINKGILDVFGPPPGFVWLEFDLVNIELRRWAYYVGNKELIAAYERKESVHLLIAEALHPKEYADTGPDFPKVYKDTLYHDVKSGNFSALYGAGEAKSDATYKVKGAKRKIADRFPEIPAFSKACEDEVMFNWNMYHQPCVTVDGGYRPDVALDYLYKAVNVKVQGSAGWIMGEAMIDVYDLIRIEKYPCKMVRQVHDSLPLELPREAVTVPMIELLKTTIEEPGLKYMGTSEASLEIVTHPNDPEMHYIDGEIIYGPL